MITEISTYSKYSGLGIAGLILGIIAICNCWIPMLIRTTDPAIFLSFYSAFILGVLSIIFGAVAYWGKQKDILGLFGITFGILVIVLVFIFGAIIFYSFTMIG